MRDGKERLKNMECQTPSPLHWFFFLYESVFLGWKRDSSPTTAYNVLWEVLFWNRNDNKQNMSHKIIMIASVWTVRYPHCLGEHLHNVIYILISSMTWELTIPGSMGRGETSKTSVPVPEQELVQWHSRNFEISMEKILKFLEHHYAIFFSKTGSNIQGSMDAIPPFPPTILLTTGRWWGPLLGDAPP